jgi:hypothetical protein
MARTVPDCQPKAVEYWEAIAVMARDDFGAGANGFPSQSPGRSRADH